MERKRFLQYSALSGAAALFHSLEGWAIHEDKKLKVAVIGCGSVSNRYIPNLQQSKLLQIVSLCDVKPARAVAQNKQYHVRGKNISEYRYHACR